MAVISGLSGIVAGFDTAGAVDEMLGLRKFEISQLKSKQDDEVARQDAIATLNGLVANFKNQSLSMSDQDKFFNYTASLNSSNAAVPASNLIDVAGDNTVTAGNHSIIVQQLATTQRSSSSIAVKDNIGSLITDGATALNFNAGSFQINGTTISVNSADSLNDIANNINNATTGVTASVIKVASSDFRLVLAADDTGAAGFTITGADLDAAGSLANLQMGAIGQSNAIQELQAAQDATINIDGLVISRSSNTIGDAIAGLTFTLKQADPTTSVSMSIGIDTLNLRDQVQTFVDSYNEVATFIDDQFKIDPTTNKNGVLAGDALLTSLKNSLSSGLLRSVPGLASDRDSLVKIGVEPDEYGVLSINDNLFSNFLNNDPGSIRDLFVAQGTTSTPNMKFLIAGDNTISGNYAVNIDHVATRASTTGTVDVVTTPLASNQTITLTEAGNQQQAIINLVAGDLQSSMVSKINAELSKVYTETRVFNQPLIDNVSTLAAAGNTSFANLGGITGETITISGTNRSGVLINSSFTILDQNQDTVSDLLFAIQSAFNQNVTASIDTAGRIQVQDSSSGNSQLSVNLSSTGTLNFGVDTTTLNTEGRYAMSLEAFADGNFITIQHKSYGSASGFSVSGANTGLGITDTGVSPLIGSNILGTINGEASTGTGQLLIGSFGSAEGIALLYEGNATAPFTSNMAIGMGAAASFQGTLDLFSNPFTGFFQNTIQSSEQIFASIEGRINTLETQLEKQRETLTRSFLLMEQVMRGATAQGDFLSQQVDAFNAKN